MGPCLTVAPSLTADRGVYVSSPPRTPLTYGARLHGQSNRFRRGASACLRARNHVDSCQEGREGERGTLAAGGRRRLPLTCWPRRALTRRGRRYEAASSCWLRSRAWRTWSGCIMSVCCAHLVSSTTRQPESRCRHGGGCCGTACCQEIVAATSGWAAARLACMVCVLCPLR